MPPTRFSVQPTLTQKGATINDTTGVQVTVEDQFGNPRVGDIVTVDLSPNPGALGGDKTKTTLAGGVATFDDLNVNASALLYTLVASTGLVSVPSNRSTSSTSSRP